MVEAGADEGMEGVMEGDEGEGWEVGDDELELPADLVSRVSYLYFDGACYKSSGKKNCLFILYVRWEGLWVDNIGYRLCVYTR